MVIEALDDKEVDFYLHADKKSNIISEIIKKNNIFLLPDNKTFDIKWGQSQMIRATINLIKEAFYSQRKYDYYWFTSGQDFPIKSIIYIKEFLQKNKGSNYINIMEKNSKQYKRFVKRNELKYPHFITNQSIGVTILKHLYIMITGGYIEQYFLREKIQQD